MKKIELTQGQFALVDDEDFEWLSQWKWQVRWDKGTQSYYAIRTEGKHPLRKTVYMHREIMKTPKGEICDHKNHDTLYNCKENLRNATRSQNQMNRRSSTYHNKLGERCICRHSDGVGFNVKVTAGGKSVYSKYFLDLEEAIVARDAALREFHGEFSPQ